MNVRKIITVNTQNYLRLLNSQQTKCCTL